MLSKLGIFFTRVRRRGFWSNMQSTHRLYMLILKTLPVLCFEGLHDPLREVEEMPRRVLMDHKQGARPRNVWSRGNRLLPVDKKQPYGSSACSIFSFFRSLEGTWSSRDEST